MGGDRNEPAGPASSEEKTQADREIAALFALPRWVLYTALVIVLAVIGAWYVAGDLLLFPSGHGIWVLPLGFGSVFGAVLTLYHFAEGRGFLRLIVVSVLRNPIGTLEPRTHVIVWGALFALAVVVAVLVTFSGIGPPRT
jgi:hypothetical protein